jgi:hypothetical protein
MVLKVVSSGTGGGGSGTVTSVTGNGTVNGITLTGTVTTAGNITLGGSLSNISNTAISNANITIGNTTIGLGNTATTVGNLSLQNANIQSVAATFPNNFLANSSNQELYIFWGFFLKFDQIFEGTNQIPPVMHPK